MARPLRIQYENGYYHVTCRGNARDDIFVDDTDRNAFLELLARSAEIYQVDILAFVLMTNHFHIVIKTPLANLQEFMRHFNISYTSWFNHRHHRVGHLYQGRYKSFVIDADNYLMEVSRYVHLNPVRIKKNEILPVKDRRKHLRNYQWSSYPDYIRETTRYSWLNRQEVLGYFRDDNPGGRKAYARFVESGLSLDIPTPLEKGKGHGIIGDKSFIEKISARYFKSMEKREVPALRKIEQQINPGRILDAVAVVSGAEKPAFLARGYQGIARGLAMELLYRHGGLSQREIGELMGIDYSSVSVGRKRFRSLTEQDKECENLVTRIQEILIQE
jgi:REP element-mobilizing transposase RayT